MIRLSEPFNAGIQDKSTQDYLSRLIKDITLNLETLERSSSSGEAVAADTITYDNTTSTLTATDVQAAIDEVEDRVDTAETDIAALEADFATLGTISTQNANNVNITGGSITGITDLTVSDGGTGASTAAGARTNLGVYSTSEVDTAIAAIPFQVSYTSSNQAIGTSTQITLTHGLGGEPELIQGHLVCTTAEFGYSIGDKILIPLYAQSDTGTNQQGASCRFTSTEIIIRIGAVDEWNIIRRDTFADAGVTAANWRLVISAWR